MVQKIKLKEEIKLAQKLSEPLVEAGKNQLGRAVYKKGSKQFGARGVISKGLANLLRNKGWYK